MALITLLLQPWDKSTPFIDHRRAEMGLHPNAICVLAALLKQASLHCQVIIATQSPTLLDEFDPENLIVVEREDGKSTFARQDPGRLRDWLEEYARGIVAEERHGGRALLMPRLHLIVEGQTEQAFVGRVLIPHLAAKGVYLSKAQLTAHVRKSGWPSGRAAAVRAVSQRPCAAIERGPQWRYVPFDDDRFVRLA